MSAEAERYARAQSLFEAARQLSASERDAWLDANCVAGTDERAFVEELLSAYEKPDSDAFSETGIGGVRAALEQVVERSSAASQSDQWLPDRIGSYRVLRRIAEGGMGVVYEAEQDSPRRRIALKVVHPLFATSTRLKRFRLEAELLGRLQHPGIAQIHEAGSYDLGRGEQPYFAMEYVEGLNLATYCAEGHLPVPSRLALLAEVCDAIQHAHDKGVIHRDLKPDNILIDASGKPKVLDFGIARATEGSTVLTTLVTEEGDLLGTIAYMAPEQLEGNPEAITSSADVYALGAIAFQLLAGRLPHDLVGLPLAAAINIAREQEPEHLRNLRPELRRDLDTIVGKALEKDPSRRYSSAGALADDLRAYLENRPIAARPPSRIYRAVKFTRRNSALVAGFTTTLVAVLVGLTIALVLRTRAEENAARARIGERKAVAGVFQATEDSLERGDLWGAALALHKLETPPDDWTYRFLKRALPTIVPNSSWFGENELIYSQPGRTGLSLWDIEAGRVTRRLFEELEFSGGPVWGYQVERGEWWLTKSPATIVRIEPSTYRVSHRFRHPDPDAPISHLQRSIGGEGRYRDLYFDAESSSWIVVSDGEAELRLQIPEGELYGSFLPSPDGQRAAYLNGSEGVLRVFSLDTGEELGVLGGLRKTSCARMNFSPDGKELLTFDSSRLVVIDVERVELIRRYDFFTVGNCDGGSISPDGRLFAVDAPIGEPVRVWDLETEQLVHSFEVELLPGTGHRVTFATDGRRLLVQGVDAPGCVLDLETGLVEAAAHSTDDDPRVMTYRGHSDYVYVLAISPDGRMIASSSVIEPSLRLWDVATGSTLAVLERPRSSDASLMSYDQLMAFSEDGRRLIATVREGGDSPRVFEWDLLTGTVESFAPTAWETHHSHTARLDQFLEQHGDLDHSDTGAPIGQGRRGRQGRLGRTAVLGDDGLALVIEGPYPAAIPAGEKWSEFIDHNEEWGLSLSPDGRQVAIAAVRTVRIYDRTSLDLLETFTGATYCVDWSPDGRLVAAGGVDGHIRLIDTEFMTELLNFKAHDDYVFSIAWTPDGTRLVSASGDATVRVWDGRRERVKEADQRVYRERLASLRSLGPEELAARFQASRTIEERGALIRVALELRRN